MALTDHVKKAIEEHRKKHPHGAGVAGTPQKKEKKEHPGFKAVQSKIEDEGYSHKVAGAILAARSRNASKAAHHANPRLNRVKG